MNFKPAATNRRHGAIIPMFAVILPIMMLFAAIAINLAYIQLAQTELDIATDASARAASKIFSTTGDFDAAHQAAVDAAELNFVAGDPLVIDSSDLELGVSNRQSIGNRYDFSPQSNGANAIRLRGNRNSDSSLGPIDTFLPNILGRASLSISSVSVSTQVEVDIALVFDRSGSMAYAFDEPAVYPPIPAAAPPGWDFGDPTPPTCRWMDAVQATNVFLATMNDSAQNEFVSLCTYADEGTIDVPLTNNYTKILSGLEFYTNQMDGGGTNIKSGIQNGFDALQESAGGRSFCAKVIVMLTDGRQTMGDHPVPKAAEMADNGVAIYTVTFSDEADQVLMREVAEAGKGQHFHANTNAELVQVFQTIAANLPTLIVD